MSRKTRLVLYTNDAVLLGIAEIVVCKKCWRFFND